MHSVSWGAAQKKQRMQKRNNNKDVQLVGVQCTKKIKKKLVARGVRDLSMSDAVLKSVINKRLKDFP